MEYKFSPKGNYEDFSCGRVIIHKTGMPNFPVRLAQEIYCRCLSYIDKDKDIRIYDPCCGGGYLLTVLGLINMNSIKEIYASAVDETALKLAKSNLSRSEERRVGKECR